jgi:signal transduction histidine kinase
MGAESMTKAISLPLWGVALLCGAAVLAAALSAAYALHARRRMRRTLETMDAMLDAAIRGDFSEDRYDESLLSSVESKLAHYLSASAVSAKNLTGQRDKINTLVSDISHQTKTPIANLVLYAQLLAEQNLPEKSRSCVEAINLQAEKLRFLIEALVKISRLEMGIFSVHAVRTPVSPMLAAAAAQARPAAEQKQISLCVEPTDAVAVLDAKWTAEAVYNLLDNAVKYTPQGGHIQVRASEYELFCRIDVTDDGIGIPEAEQARIFSRFYRGQEVHGCEGTGLGLYLARQIASDEGGYLKVASAPGKGSTFSLFLPRAKEASAASGVQTTQI